MRVAFLISGGGTTMGAIINACHTGRLMGVEPALVIANRQCGGLQRARDLGMSPDDICIISPKDFASAEEFGEAIIHECNKHRVEFIGQYGWLTKTPDNVIERFKNNIINQHPGPLDPHGNGDFGGFGMYGLRVHAARLYFVQKTGRDFWTEATTHRVTSRFDEGAIVGAVGLEILPNDTPESLQERLLPIEHELQIQMLADFKQGLVQDKKRDYPLITKEERGILEWAKERAIKEYPNG